MQVSSAEVRPEVLQAGTWTEITSKASSFGIPARIFHWQAQKEMAELRCQLEAPCFSPIMVVLVVVDVSDGKKQDGYLLLAAGELMARL